MFDGPCCQVLNTLKTEHSKSLLPRSFRQLIMNVQNVGGKNSKYVSVALTISQKQSSVTTEYRQVQVQKNRNSLSPWKHFFFPLFLSGYFSSCWCGMNYDDVVFSNLYISQFLLSDCIMHHCKSVKIVNLWN